MGTFFIEHSVYYIATFGGNRKCNKEYPFADLAVSGASSLHVRSEVVAIAQEIIVADESLDGVTDDVDVYRTG